MPTFIAQGGAWHQCARASQDLVAQGGAWHVTRQKYVASGGVWHRVYSNGMGRTRMLHLTGSLDNNAGVDINFLTGSVRTWVDRDRRTVWDGAVLAQSGQDVTSDLYLRGYTTQHGDYNNPGLYIYSAWHTYPELAKPDIQYSGNIAMDVQMSYGRSDYGVTQPDASNGFVGSLNIWDPQDSSGGNTWDIFLAFE